MLWKELVRKGYTFRTEAGILTGQQLFTAKDATLASLENRLKSEVEEAKSGDRFGTRSSNYTVLANKLGIVTDVIETIISERKAAAVAKDSNEELQELLAIKADIQKEEKKKMSLKDVNKRIEELQKQQ